MALKHLVTATGADTSPTNQISTNAWNNAHVIDANGIDVTNVAVFTGSITTTTLSVTAVTSGVITVGQLITGTGVTASTYISALQSGNNTTGASTWTVSISQNVASTTITASGVPNLTNAPVAASTARLFSRSLGGKQLGAFIGPDGLDVAIQAHLGRQKVAWLTAVGGNTTTVNTFGLATPTSSGGTPTARAEATTNIATRMRRIGYVSAATAGSVTGLHFTTSLSYTMGNAAGLGGFLFTTRFVVSDPATVTGAMQFIGMSSATTTPIATTATGNPSVLTNVIGLAQLSGSATQWNIVYGGSAAQTAIALGTAIGAPTLTTTAWEFTLYAPSNATTVSYMLTNLGSNITVSGSIAAGTAGVTLPATTTLLAPRWYRANNATALAVGLDIVNAYIETDY